MILSFKRYLGYVNNKEVLAGLSGFIAYFTFAKMI